MTQEKNWYIGCSHGKSRAAVTGPFPTREEADASIDEAHKLAEKVDGYASLYDWWTASFPAELKIVTLKQRLNGGQ